MSKPIPAAQIKELRHQLATVLSGTSAYKLPQLCQRLGLAEGSTDEAMKSKYSYVERRLLSIKAERVLEVAHAFLEEDTSFPLAEVVARIDERNGPQVTDLTRRRLIQVFEQRPLTTLMSNIDLLKRVWPIAEMRPVHDFHDGSLEDDIVAHTILHDDWSTTELLGHVGLMTCSQATLFTFLAEAVGPMAQMPSAQGLLVSELNTVLQLDGYRLTVTGRMSGSPVYAVRPSRLGSPADAGISAALEAFDPDNVHARWTAAVDRRQEDPEGAITLARTLLEDVCKWVLDEAGVTYEDRDDLPALYRKLSKTLRLAPDDYTEKSFQQLLGSCQQIVELLGSLRSKLGDAHSPGPKRSRPQPRHAELAVNLSGTMATFLVSTWQARKANPPANEAISAAD